jgi:signal transduction histidine kinase
MSGSIGPEGKTARSGPDQGGAVTRDGRVVPAINPPEDSVTAANWRPVPPQPTARPLLTSPPKMLAILVVWVFFGELGEMIALSYFPPLPVKVEAVVDALVLLLLLSPTYWLFYRPLVRLNEERIQTEREVRQLSRQLLEASEEEKKRLARDLHDECGQSLTALKFMVETLKTTLPTATTQKSEAQVERIEDLVAHLSREIRSLTADLRPAMLDEMGLVPALRWHVERFSSLVPNLSLSFESKGCSKRLSPEAEVALFRCCQEALNNVIKHSRAQRAAVMLECTAATISLLVEDDGCGFDLQRQRKRTDRAPGVGLAGMRERMVAIGGYLTINSSPEGGTRVFMILPAERNPT